MLFAQGCRQTESVIRGTCSADLLLPGMCGAAAHQFQHGFATLSMHKAAMLHRRQQRSAAGQMPRCVAQMARPGRTMTVESASGAVPRV